MTHLDLFSGIGGFKLAAEWAGFETLGFSEIEPFACKVLTKHWPIIKNYGDITAADFGDLTDRITVLTGGFPCQPWSAAGKQRGEADDRHLWPSMLNVIKCVRPTWIIGENVPGIISLGQLDRCCEDLEQVSYAVQPFVIPAASVGASHLRERVWIIANTYCSGLEEREGQNSRGTRTDSGTVIKRELSRLTQSPLCGRADGISNRSHRIKGLGNAIVPQVVYPFFEWIKQIESTNQS